MFLLYFLFSLDFLNVALLVTSIAKFVIVLDGSNLYLGWLWFTSSLIGLIWKPITGNLSGRRSCKTLLIWCLLPCIVGNIISSFATSLNMLFIGRTLCALGAPVQTLLKTVTTDLISKEKQAPIFNKVAAYSSISFALGAIVSGHLSEYNQGLKVIYLIMATNYFISAVTIYGFISNSEVKPKTKTTDVGLLENLGNEFKKSFQNLKTVCLSNRYFDVLVVKIATDFSHMILVSNVGMTLRIVYSLSDKFISYLTVMMSILGVATNLTMARINKTPNDSKTNGMFYCCFMLFISYIGLILADTGEGFGAVLCFLAVVKTVLESLVNAELLERIEENEKALVFSSFDTVNSLSDLSAPLIASSLVEYVGAQMHYVLCCIILVITISFIHRQKTKTR